MNTKANGVLTFLIKAILSWIGLIRERKVMSRFQMFLVLAMLVVLGAPAATQTPVAIYADYVSEQRLEINCLTNEQTISGLQNDLVALISSTKPLQIKRQKKNLSEAENQLLLQAEAGIANTLLVVSSHQFAQFYCDNPDLVPVVPIDPKSLT
ncbi:MAG: hypothetical protein AAB618_02295 [Patescibacteria group bacterium]